MRIDDPDFCFSVLQQVNYYRLMAFTLTYKKNDGSDKYIDGTSFTDIFDLYQFDYKLRHMLVGVLEGIEIAFRTKIAYYFGHTYGSLGYTKSEYSSNEEHHLKMLDELKKAIESNQEVFVEHHLTKYGGQFPVWVAVELLSFGVVSKFYANMLIEDKKAITSKYYNTTTDYLSTWIRTAVHLRNTSAHYGRLYNKFLKVTPKLHNRFKNKLENKLLFTGLFVLRELAPSQKEWLSFVTNLEALIEEYSHVVDLAVMGFPDDWESYLRDNKYCK